MSDERTSAMRFSDSKVRIDLSVRCLEWGDPLSPSVVLVHDGGNGSDALTCWKELAEQLSRKFHVFAPDLTGYGGTAKAVWFDNDPIRQRVEFLAALCDQRGIDAAVFVGNSFGGAVVLSGAAHRTLPITRGVSICGTGGPYMIQDRFELLRNYTPSLESSRYLWSQMVMQPTDTQVERRHTQSLTRGHWEALAAARLRNPESPPLAPQREEYLRALREIGVPILLIAGECDELLENGWEDEMSRMIPDARGRRIPLTKHQPHVDRPDLVAAHIFDFAGAIDA